MARATGIGGIFFKAKDPKGLHEWYVKHLGLPVDENGYTTIRWGTPEALEQSGTTVWSAFSEDTDYLDPGRATFMINYRVDDLDALLAQLREAGVEVMDEVQEYEYGRFGWAIDPEGNKFELWEPPAGM